MRFKKVLFVVAVVLFAAIIFRLVTPSSQNANQGHPMARGGHGERRQEPTVAVENVSHKSFRNIVFFTGDIKPMYDMAIVARTTGQIVEIYKRPGQRVRANEVIAVLENSEQQNAVNEAAASHNFAKAQLVEAKNNHAVAQKELERSKTLFEREFISQAQFDAARSQYLSRVSALELAKAQVLQRESSLNTARLRLSYTRLKAPKPGVVGDMFFDRGTVINQGTQLTSVVSIDSVKCEIRVPEHLVSQIKRGMAAIVVREGEGRNVREEHSATVFSVSPIIDRQSRTAEVEVIIDNSNHSLKPGMFARVLLIMAQRDSALGVPERAIVEYNLQRGVFGVVGDSMVQFVPVKTGFSEGGFVEIIGDKIPKKIVTEGQFMLSDGAKIQIAGQEKIKSETTGKNPHHGKGHRQ